MDYDVLILGGGIIGCAIAYNLSKYNINIALIEKKSDIADDISVANTAVIYDGAETDDDIMASLEKCGMEIIKNDCKKFDVYYKKTGAFRISKDKTEVNKIDKILNRAVGRNIKGVSIKYPEDIKKIDPNFNINVNNALYSENVSVINPYDLTISYAEVAADNNVTFKLEEKVINIKSISQGFKVTTNKNKFTCKIVINTIPSEFCENIDKDDTYKSLDRKMNYILFNNMDNAHMPDSVIINDINSNLFIISIPTSSKATLIGIKGKKQKPTLNESINYAKQIFGNIKPEQILNVFTENYGKDNIRIDNSNIDEGYIKVTGSHYSKITIAPAIASIIEKNLKNKINITLKKDYVDKRRETYVFNNMTNEERNNIIKIDKRYGNIVCTCHNITEGEIIDSIRRPLGARTLKGVKRRTGISIGNCNGSYCNMKIMKILAREMDTSLINIVEDSADSQIITSKIKQFNEI
ncbi:FAD-dependent oxidoreductase [Clostridium sp. BJN0001]|uniref:NAD(P)/FAD-dependent oxidoreductase n=1 Tax=Clostridium sp. BJN0001 TaxID=2930219 RepID=UPI001FD59F35|nr:FAD-dependent oxidoreductase [Clostridium sp. BJN0001]